MAFVYASPTELKLSLELQKKGKAKLYRLHEINVTFLWRRESPSR